MGYLKNIVYAILFTASFACAGNGQEKIMEVKPQKTKTQKNITAPTEILVKFKPGTDPEYVKKIQGQYGLEIVKELSTSGLYLMKVVGDVSLETVLKNLKKLDRIKYAEPNHKYRINNK